MAWVDSPQTEDEEKKTTGTTGNEQVLTSGDSGPIGGGAGGSAVAAKPTSSGTGFTNLQNYVTANEGNDGQMAGKISGAVGANAEKAKSGQSAFKETSTGLVKDATITDDGIIDTIKTDAASIAGDEDKKAQYYKQSTAEYTGPDAYTDVVGYDDVDKSVNTIVQNVKDSGSHDGRFNLLDDSYGRSSYTGGEKNLDSFLLGAGNQGRQAMSDIKTNYQGADNAWASLKDFVTGEINTGRETTNKTRTDTQLATDEAVTGLEGTFAEYQAQLAKEAAANKETLAKLTAGVASDDPKIRTAAYNQMGFTPAEIQQAEFLVANGSATVSQIVQAGQERALGDIAGEGEIGNYNALMGLTGTNSQFNFDTTGSDGSAFSLNRDVMGQAEDAKGIQTTIQSRLPEAQTKRDTQYGQLAGAFTSFTGPTKNDLKTIGITQAEYDEARALGINPLMYLSKGKKLNVGDVATDQERQGWSNLMLELGIESDFDIADRQNEGSYFSFNKSGFKEIVDKKRAEAKKKAEAEAARDKKIKQQIKDWQELERRRNIGREKTANGEVGGWIDEDGTVHN